MRIKAGKYRQHAIIEKPVAGDANEYNEKANSYTAFAAIWCSIIPASPKESEYAKRFAATVSHTIETRYFPGVKPTMRVNFGGRFFQINGVVNEEELNTKLIIYATEVI